MITNLAIQRRRLHELQELEHDPDSEFFNIELAGASDHEIFSIHARRLTPQNVWQLDDQGFQICRVERVNDFTLKIRLCKIAPEKERI